MHQQKIVILGGGFGGLRLARQLGKLGVPRDADVTLIDREAHHVYTPSLYEVVCGASPKEVCIAIHDALAGTGVVFQQAVVKDINLKSRAIRLGNGKRIHFDQLVLALGSMPNFYGIPGVEEYAYPLKTLRDAWSLRAHIEREFALARTASGGDASRELSFLVAGGGPAGVELAGELAEFRLRLAREYGIPVKKSHIEILEAGPDILGRAAPRTKELAKKRLAALGVRITTGTPVKREQVQEVILGNSRRLSETLVWTAGVTPSGTIQSVRGLQFDKQHRILVDGSLRALGRKFVWAIGDVASTEDAGVATSALRHADLVAKNIERSLRKKKLSMYEPHHPNLLMPIGHGYAVGQFGNVVLAGWFGLWLKRWYDLRYLVSVLPFAKAISVWLAHHEPCPDCHIKLRDAVGSAAIS